MKKLMILCVSLCWFATACVADDEQVLGEDESAVLVSTPDAGSDPGIVAPCPPDMPPSYCDPEGGEGGGTGGGTGGGGGSGGGGGAGGGNPLPCLGSDNNWCSTHRRCERPVACRPQDADPPVPFEDAICRRETDTGRCQCIY